MKRWKLLFVGILLASLAMGAKPIVKATWTETIESPDPEYHYNNGKA